MAIQNPSMAATRGVGQGINESAPDCIPGSNGTPATGTKVVGLFMDDFVDIDQTVQHRNFFKTQQVLGENACLLKQGMLWTNRVNGTPLPGSGAYLGASGNLQTTQVNSIPAVGEFKTSKDTDGYVKVFVKLA